MSLLDRDDAWQPLRLGARVIEVLELEHPSVTERIVSEIEAGTSVYYDRRWRVSERFAEFLEEHPSLLRDRRVLVLGCGVGLEALAAAPHAARVILNDLSATAVELSAVQLERNGFAAHDALVGRYEDLPLPPVDLCIGSFLIYDAESVRAMVALMERVGVPVLLANDPMDAFDELLHACGRRIRRCTAQDDTPIVWFEARVDARRYPEGTMSGETDLATLLGSLQPTLHEATFVWCTLPPGTPRPAGLTPVVEVREAEGATLVVPREQAEAVALAWTFPSRMITLDVHSSLAAVGLLARVATALADRGIAANAVAGYFHDHLFVPAERAEDALTALAALSDGSIS